MYGLECQGLLSLCWITARQCSTPVFSVGPLPFVSPLAQRDTAPWAALTKAVWLQNQSWQAEQVGGTSQFKHQTQCIPAFTINSSQVLYTHFKNHSRLEYCRQPVCFCSKFNSLQHLFHAAAKNMLQLPCCYSVSSTRTELTLSMRSRRHNCVPMFLKVPSLHRSPVMHRSWCKSPLLYASATVINNSATSAADAWKGLSKLLTFFCQK